MTWNEWVEVYFDNQSDKTLKIKNFKNESGFLYVAGDSGRKDMSKDDIENLSLAPYPRDEPGFGNSGYSTWTKGCEGSLEIFIKDTETKICKISWNCPYWTKQNSFNISEKNDDFVIKQRGGSMYSTAIGAVYVKILRPN